jgi:DNA repair protein RadC
LSSAAALLLIHNHPSGDPTPSKEDFEITNRLKEASELLGIRLLDHVIIGDPRHYSFADQGLL